MEAVPELSEPSEPAVPKQLPYAPPPVPRLASSAQLDTDAERPKLQFHCERPIKQPLASSAQLDTVAGHPIKLQFYHPIEQTSFASIVRRAQTIGSAVFTEEPASTVRIGLWAPDGLNIQQSGIIEINTIVLNILELNGTWSSASFPGAGAEWDSESKTLSLDMEVVPT